jgi:hypothetical protein
MIKTRKPVEEWTLGMASNQGLFLFCMIRQWRTPRTGVPLAARSVKLEPEQRRGFCPFVVLLSNL